MPTGGHESPRATSGQEISKTCAAKLRPMCTHSRRWCHLFEPYGSAGPDGTRPNRNARTSTHCPLTASTMLRPKAELRVSTFLRNASQALHEHWTHQRRKALSSRRHCSRRRSLSRSRVPRICLRFTTSAEVTVVDGVGWVVVVVVDAAFDGVGLDESADGWELMWCCRI